MSKVLKKLIRCQHIHRGMWSDNIMIIISKATNHILRVFWCLDYCFVNSNPYEEGRLLQNTVYGV